MLTKGKYCSLDALISEKTTPSRMLWGCMYTMFFASAWLSFYSTEVCIQLVTKNKIVRTSIYLSMGLVVYWLLFLTVPMTIHLMHRIMKERVESLKVVCGARGFDAIYMFIMGTIFPTFSISMKRILFVQGAALWSWMGLVGAIFCLFVFYINPDDYGLDDAFNGLWLGVLASLDGFLEQITVLSIIIAASKISKNRQKTSAKEALILRETQKKGTPEKVAEMQKASLQ